MQTAEDRLKLAGEEVACLLEELSLSFWVDFTEVDFADATTVGGLFDCVRRKMPALESSRCLTSLAFFRLRPLIAEVAAVDRRSIRPASLLRNTVPARVRPELWELAQNRLRLRLPGLKPGRLARCLIWIVAGLICAGFFLLYLYRDWALAAACATVVWLLCKVVSCLPRDFPVATVEDLVRTVVVLNQGKLARQAGGSTVEQAWSAFRELIGRAANIHPRAIRHDMRFPEDLKLY